MTEALQPITVYYVIGLPRSGSTFVGDWIARHLGVINAGEVWQTFRSLGRVHDADFERRDRHWANPEARAQKNADIEAHPFWAEVLGYPNDDPYAALVAVAGARCNALVDCSKTDQGISRYQAVGCLVVVVHTVRAFSSWRQSMRKYHSRYSLPRITGLRLLSAYLRVNRKLRRYDECAPYCVVPQERLGQISAYLEFSFAPSNPKGGYMCCEMFGTPGYTSIYEPARSTSEITLLDKWLYALIEVRFK